MNSKTDLRKEILDKRKKLNTKNLSLLICQNIVKNEIYKNAKIIFAYYPMTYEADISLLFEDNSKQWFLPKVFGDDMQFFEYKIGDALKKSKFGVLEPEINDTPTNAIPDLIIVPAVSVDINNYRLGYGKGYYDRFLSQFDVQPKTLTPIFSNLIQQDLPKEKHDKKIDIIITEKEN